MLPRQKSSHWERLVANAALSLIESKRKNLYIILFALSWLLMAAPLIALAVMMLVSSFVTSSFVLLFSILVYIYVAGVGLLLVYQGWRLSNDPNFIKLAKHKKRN